MQFVFLFFHAIKLTLQAIYDFCLQFTVSVTQTKMQIANVTWKTDSNTMTTTIKNITMHVSFHPTNKNWVWQLGNDVYYERGFANSELIAKQYVLSGMAKHVLVIAAEKISTLIDWKDRSTCCLLYTSDAADD